MKNDQEARAIEAVVQAIDALFDKYGTDLSDKEYLEKVEWARIVCVSKDALKVLLHGK